MPKRLLLFYLPIVVVLFSCVLALPQEVTEPVASVTESEPTPVPLDQATSTTAFDVPDTPVPTATSAPSATPTPVVVDPIAEGEKMALLCAFVL